MKITPQQIIEEALECAMKDEGYSANKSFLRNLFHRLPSEKEIKSRTILYLSNRISNQVERAEKAEQKMYEIIKECLRFIEQREPKRAMEIYQKYLTPEIFNSENDVGQLLK